MLATTKHFLKRPHNRRGQGMVEFALAIPVFLLLVFGVIEFGRFLFTYAAVFSASREGARYGAAVGTGGAGTAVDYPDCQGIRDNAVRVGSYAGVTSASVTTVAYDHGGGSTFANCTQNAEPSPAIKLGDRVVVTVDVTFTPIVPMTPFGRFHVTSTTRRLIVKSVEVSGALPDTATPMPTATHTAGPSPTPTRTSTSTNTPTPTETPTVTETPTETATHTPTSTVCPPSVCTPTPTPTNTPTRTATPTNTATATNTPSPTPTDIPCPLYYQGFVTYNANANTKISVDFKNNGSVDATIASIQVAWSGTSNPDLKSISYLGSTVYDTQGKKSPVTVSDWLPDSVMTLSKLSTQTMWLYFSDDLASFSVLSVLFKTPTSECWWRP